MNKDQRFLTGIVAAVTVAAVMVGATAYYMDNRELPLPSGMRQKPVGAYSPQA